ncbi:Uu.00g031430.m01.CDS01 [Anthostomella pinea]|uniref:Uu.00g031430.m01.CDS01 n=1 Tax=Anthostomella pinea TaxID=933095 RepID=A0AAI8V9H6_9PEZI|nr:Uu.00g031430.m01.CDS01 [Anthostomella pinea]
MADVQKPVAVPDTAPAVADPIVDAKPVDETPSELPVAEPSTATETPAETKTEETAAPVEEAKKEEVKPIEAGTLEHKGAPANFPKNFMYQKNYFWFGTDALEKEKLATYLKNEKATDVGHHVASWATETGKGLLFYGKEADKATPAGAIQLSEASEPTVDGANKFHFTSKGHKHTFKASSTAERDNWVEQLKLKITEAKDLAPTVTESATYKHTLDSFKPAAAAKKEETPAVAAAASTEETPKEEAKEEKKEAKEEKKEEKMEAKEEKKEAKEEKKEEKKEAKEEKKDESKRRSASRKRTSIFGTLLNKKDESKKETPAADDKAVEASPVALPAEVEPVADETTQAPVTEATPVEEPKKEEAATATKPKRQSLFGNLSFGKKPKAETDSAPATPAKDTTAIAPLDEPVAETAPVIPAVETTEPLSAEVASPATVPTETTDITPATNGETKKEVKSEKRKSSLPFAFGKKEKSATSDEEGEKTKSPPFFSKFRQTINRGNKDKTTDKSAEEAIAEDKPAEATDATAETKAEEPVTAPVVDETPVEQPAAAGPAPVTAAA